MGVSGGADLTHGEESEGAAAEESLELAPAGPTSTGGSVRLRRMPGWLPSAGTTSKRLCRLTKEADPVSTKNLVPSAVRTEELARISSDLAEANAHTSDDLAEANLVLARTTQASAELLAKTTQASAELLATITRESADQLRESNELSRKLVNRLTIILVVIGLVQIAVTAIAAFKGR